MRYKRLSAIITVIFLSFINLSAQVDGGNPGINKFKSTSNLNFTEVFSQLPYHQASYQDQFINDYRVNEQVGNSQKSTIKTAINDNDISIVVWSDYREGTQNIYAQLTNNIGEAISENIKINSPEDRNSYSYPDVAVNEDNEFLVVWFDYRSGYAIYGQLLKEDGSFISENFRIDDDENTAYKIQPTISSNGKNFVVAWSDARRGYNYDIFAQKLEKDGTKIGENFIVNSDSQTVRKNYADIALDKNGNIFVVWNSTISGIWKAYGSVTDWEGNLKGEDFQINEESAENYYHYYPQVAASSSGFVSTWYRYLSGKYDIISQICDTSGSMIDSNRVINDFFSSSRTYANVASDSLGNYIITWADYRDGYSAIYSQEFENDSLVNANIRITNEDQKGSKSNISSSVNNDNKVITAWLDLGEPTEYQIYSQLSLQNGEAITNDFRVDDDSKSSFESEPAINIFDDGSYIVVWTDRRTRSSRVYFQRFDESGNPVGENIPTITSGSNYRPKVIPLKDDNFLIIWREYNRGTFNQNEIMGQKYFKNGEKIGEKFAISSELRKGSAEYPDISRNENGEFVATWEKRVNGINRIFAQKFNDDGSYVGETIEVANDTTVSFYRPKVGIDSLCNFGITYYGYVNGKNDIFLNRFSADATPIDSGYSVSDDSTNSSKYHSDISVNSSGEFIITWFSYGAPSGIYFQMFEDIGAEELVKINEENLPVADYSVPFSIPKVGLNNSGEFAVSWSEITSTGYDLKFRMFNESIDPVTEVLYVSQVQERSQIKQDIIFKNGNIYNVWQDNAEQGIGYDIWANVYNYNDFITGVESSNSELPTQFSLEQNYPNPFNPTTTIKYTVPASVKILGHASLQLIIYDILGREVKTLVNKKHSPGDYEISVSGSELTSGVYFYTLSIGDFVETKKMILLK